MMTSPCSAAAARHFSAHFPISKNKLWYCWDANWMDKNCDWVQFLRVEGRGDEQTRPTSSGKSVKLSTCALSTNEDGQIVSSQSKIITEFCVVVMVLIIISVVTNRMMLYYQKWWTIERDLCCGGTGGRSLGSYWYFFVGGVMASIVKWERWRL